MTRQIAFFSLIFGGVIVSFVAAETDPQLAIGEARYYGGDLGSTKYSPLDQINASNILQLKIAWRHPAVEPKLLQDNPDLEVSNNFRSTPLMVKGVLYSSNAVGLVEAIDPATGKTLWTQAPAGMGIQGMQGVASRAIAYWAKGNDERIVTVRGKYLFLLDAKTGKAATTFGDNGMVDLTSGVPNKHFVWIAPGPMVVKDVIVIGGNATATDTEFTDGVLPGDIRGFDVASGKLLWTFHTVPREGDPGVETWLKDSWKTTGKTKMWSLMSADEELGYLYAPLSAPTNDWYGGLRPGVNLFSDSLVCLDLRTGKLVWHYQLVHHDLWDYDLPAAPILTDLNVDGKRIKAVLQVTKMAFVFAFDRVTGKPIWPIEERPVPQTNVPGEWISPTQPFPSKPAPFDRQGLTEADLIDFTPELHAEAVEILNHYVHGQMFTPPTLKGQGSGEKKGLLFLPGWVGGANWTGAAIDRETGILYVPSVTVPYLVGLIEKEGTYRRAPEPTLYLDGPRGLPLTRPPYGRITAIDMNKGEHLWMAPNGGGPRDHPALKGLNLPPLGQPGRAAPLLTKTLLLLGEGDMVGLSMPPFSGGNMFRAYDKKTGQVLWEKDLGAGTTGAPTTYLHKGKQYVVVAVGGVKHAPELVAFTLL